MTAPTKEEAAAIERFVLSATVPILYETVNGTALQASGTLFEAAGRQFIITARHIFDDLPDLKKLAYPENPQKGDTYTFGNFQISKPTEEYFDVAVMELQSSETISKLKAGWQFLSVANVALPSASASDGSFFLSGYPASLTKKTGDSLRGSFVTAYTQRIPHIPDEAERPVIPDLDLFFDYGRDATSITGTSVRTPDLRGCSGASVWERKRESPTVWTPESVVRVVGVQSASFHSKYFRAKSWWAVSKVLEKIDSQIALEIQSDL